MEFITVGETQYTYKKYEKHIIGKHLTLNNLKSIPAGYGGHIGIIPQCTIDGVVYNMLCDIQWHNRIESGMVVGTLGGGIKRTQRPYDALYRELYEEVPAWVQLLHTHLEQSDVTIYSIEYLHAKDNYMRYSITIIMDVTYLVKEMYALFTPSKEIIDLKGYDDIEYYLFSLPELSYGLQYYRNYLIYKKRVEIEHKPSYD